MITWLRWDWEESPTLEDIREALKPHGLTVKSLDDGDEYAFAIYPADAGVTDDQIVDSIIEDYGSAESPGELHTYLKSLLND